MNSSPCPQEGCPYTDRDQCALADCPQRFKRKNTHTQRCLSSLYAAALSAAGVILLPAPAAFSSTEILTIHHDPAPGDAWFARIVIYNGDSSSDNIYRFDTAHGVVTVTYDSSPNQGCEQAPEGCADDVSVDVPAGVIPSEWEARLYEYETRTIYLYEFLGG